MTDEMFCFQCEQTAGGTGCKKKSGVCGKQADTANLQDLLTAELIDLACAAVNNAGMVNSETNLLMLEGLFSTVTNVCFDDETIGCMLHMIRKEKRRLAPHCRSRNANTYDMKTIWHNSEDVRSLQSLILFGLRGMAAYAYHAMVLGYTDNAIYRFIYKSLSVLADDSEPEELVSEVLAVGEMNYRCMELLDRTNTEIFGIPEPVTVPLMIEKGPFIVVTGHDLHDLQCILEQTKSKGINIYTHGEMLPAHSYPELKKYAHLKGNFGTAWQNQQKEFSGIPAPILFTTNCLMPPKSDYADRVFTTSVVNYPGIAHINECRDFSPVIQRAYELGGYTEPQKRTGINGGTSVTTGYSFHYLASMIGKIADNVRSGKIRRVFLIGGCDGAKPGRNYYTELIKKIPEDCIILTLACGKYRFNDMDFGEIDGIPRLLDMGQCNDAYGAIRFLIALSESLKCSVNELPVSIILSWYEQKAVCILLTLLHLDVKNILLGPTLPAFLSVNILTYLADRYNLRPITTPDNDLETILHK